MPLQPVWIEGRWTESSGTGSFSPVNPNTGEPLPEKYPVSPWSDVDRALACAARVARLVEDWPGRRFAEFLEAFADAVEARKAELVETAHRETGLPAEPRLASAEFPRTTGQLRQAAAAARQQSWSCPTIDTKANIRSMFGPIGPVAVFGPNNFPFAFNSCAGGDFAAAVAAGNPVIAKGHPGHPGTTQGFARAAEAAVQATGFPPGFVQLLYRIDHADGARLVSDPRLGATGYTGGQHAGLALKRAADAAGKPIYLELSSINPVVILPGALRERGAQVAEEFASSCLMGAGQFCTNPGLVLLIAGPETEAFLAAAAERFRSAAPGTLLGPGVLRSLGESLATLVAAGAEVVVGGSALPGARCAHENTLLRTTGAHFLAHPRRFQTEAFGNCSLCVVCASGEELAAVLDILDGNLTGTIYSDSAGSDDALYAAIAPVLRRKVGRLLNDKMPTGVAVSPAMNHGGPYPATGHPGFTAVGIPAAIRRFGALWSYDNVRAARLPPALRDETAGIWRLMDGAWTQAPVS